MKKRTIFIISLIALLLLFCLILILSSRDLFKNTQYSCDLYSDCVSQCSRGCVNNNWADLNPDISECFRAWDCSCVDNQCYTDGKPRVNLT
jgi:hypothetical protein